MFSKTMSTKTKIAAAALAALTITTALATTGSQAQAGHRHGVGLGIGFAAGALIGAAVASNAYAGPSYVVRECRYVERYDRWGNIRMVRICNY
jgi:uncharacterized membrane protein YfcA